MGREAKSKGLSQGDDEVILSPRPADRSEYLSSGLAASEDFIEEVEDLPVQERGSEPTACSLPLSPAGGVW